MKRRELIIKFTYDGLNLIKNNHIYSYTLNKSVENHKVINSTIFLKDFSSIIDNLKLNNNLLSENIKIIIDSTYTYEELKTISSIFKELSFNKISFINILNLLNINNQELVLELNTYNFKIYYLNNTYKGDIYFNKPLSIIDSYLKEIIPKSSIEYIYIYGKSPYINKLITYIEKKYHLKAYFYSYPTTYPLNEFID